jgi:hypothetical protein
MIESYRVAATTIALSRLDATGMPPALDGVGLDVASWRS